MIQIEASLGQVISEIAQARNVISETELEALQIEQEYRERANSELEEVRSEISELEQRKTVAEDILGRTEIRAPGSGTIQNLKVHTVGSVIRAGDAKWGGIAALGTELHAAPSRARAVLVVHPAA